MLVNWGSGHRDLEKRSQNCNLWVKKCTSCVKQPLGQQTGFNNVMLLPLPSSSKLWSRSLSSSSWPSSSGSRIIILGGGVKPSGCHHHHNFHHLHHGHHHNSHLRLNSLGLLCLWQCFPHMDLQGYPKLKVLVAKVALSPCFPLISAALMRAYKL